MYYIGTKGNIYYIINKETEEAAYFSAFGELQGITTSRLALIDVFNKTIDVDIVSILGNSLYNTSDVLFNNRRVVVNKKYTEVLSVFQKSLGHLKQNSILYRVPHVEVNMSQVILVFKKGTINTDIISDYLGISKTSWSNLI